MVISSVMVEAILSFIIGLYWVGGGVLFPGAPWKQRNLSLPEIAMDCDTGVDDLV